MAAKPTDSSAKDLKSAFSGLSGGASGGAGTFGGFGAKSSDAKPSLSIPANLSFGAKPTESTSSIATPALTKAGSASGIGFGAKQDSVSSLNTGFGKDFTLFIDNFANLILFWQFQLGFGAKPSDSSSNTNTTTTTTTATNSAGGFSFGGKSGDANSIQSSDKKASFGFTTDSSKLADKTGTQTTTTDKSADPKPTGLIFFHFLLFFFFFF